MTTHEALVRDLYAHFNARDIDAVLAVLAADVAWANGMTGGHVHGHEGLRAYWTAQWSDIDPHVEPVTVTEEDGATVVEVHQTVRDLQGKLLLDEPVCHVFRFEDGRVARFDIRSGSGLASLPHGS